MGATASKKKKKEKKEKRELERLLDFEAVLDAVDNEAVFCGNEDVEAGESSCLESQSNLPQSDGASNENDE